MTGEPFEQGGLADAETGRPLLLFDSDDPEFTRGFEAGVVWATLKAMDDLALLAREDTIVEYVHNENVEMVLRIAEARGWQARSSDVDDDYMRVTFSRPASPDAQNAP